MLTSSVLGFEPKYLPDIYIYIYTDRERESINATLTCSVCKIAHTI